MIFTCQFIYLLLIPQTLNTNRKQRFFYVHAIEYFSPTARLSHSRGFNRKIDKTFIFFISGMGDSTNDKL